MSITQICFLWNQGKLAFPDVPPLPQPLYQVYSVSVELGEEYPNQFYVWGWNFFSFWIKIFWHDVDKTLRLENISPFWKYQT